MAKAPAFCPTCGVSLSSGAAHAPDCDWFSPADSDFGAPADYLPCCGSLVDDGHKDDCPVVPPWR